MRRLEHAPRKIAVLRANGLGDFLLATPALRALGKAFPGAQITYLTHPWLLGFIAGRYPYVHRVEGIPPYPKIHDPGPNDPPQESAEAFFDRLRAERFDLAIQMHGGGIDSNPFVTQLGANHTLGLAATGASPLERNLRYCYYQHEIIRYLELVGMLGVPWDGLDMDLPLLPRDHRHLAEVWQPGPEPYAIIHAGAGDPRRRWPAESFALVAEHIHRRAGLAVVLTGREAEREVTGRLRAACRVPVTDLTARLDLGAMAALVSGARLVVCNDTGPAHMAYALNRPSVVVYWCGNLVNAGPFKRERFRPVLSWTLRCPSCGSAKRCSCPVSWVAEAPVEEVLWHV
ncbi:MAG: glycosyltransferase family 9 protein, partial [Anaerolineae bacterium]|nr:glycosyltransferase family 9 protein [Anaerolineae bacterium]